MKVIILAGGQGTRLAEHTKTIPKPMVKIGNYPIIIHIINHYLRYDFNEFFIAAGYKSYVIKRYFKNFNYDRWYWTKNIDRREIKKNEKIY